LQLDCRAICHDGATRPEGGLWRRVANQKSTASARQTRERSFQQPGSAANGTAGDRGSAGQRMELGVNLGHFLTGTDRLVGVDGLSPGGACRARVADRAGDLSQLAQHLGVEQPVLSALRLINRDAQGGDALVQRAALALDGRTDFERPGGAQMVTPPLGLIECLAAALIREVEPTKADPDFSQVELDHIFNNAVAAVDGDRQATLEESACLLEVSDFGVKN